MEIERFIEEEVKMILNDFGLSQIRNDVWHYVFRNGIGVLTLDAMLDRCMVLYAEIIKRSGV